jgi:hypothetical protein
VRRHVLAAALAANLLWATAARAADIPNHPADLAAHSPDVAAEPPQEVPISVPSPIPVGFLIAWKPTLLSVRVDNGAGGVFGSDKFQSLRFLGRYTTGLFRESLFARAELEGGEFQSDSTSTTLGTEGYDVTARLLGGTATRITPGFVITASAGMITRYQRGRAVGGAPSIGIFGATSNIEFEYRLGPLFTVSAYFEGGLAPLPYGAQKNLGTLSDASELRFRLQISMDVGTSTAIDLGYDFTRWHAAFSQSNALDPTGPANQALLLEDREHAITLGIRWKP